jgi:hypothetical protein
MNKQRDMSEDPLPKWHSASGSVRCLNGIVGIDPHPAKEAMSQHQEHDRGATEPHKKAGSLLIVQW